MSEQVFLRDAPYEFVPLLEKCERDRYSGHHIMEKGTYTGRLRLRITAESPLHIGCPVQDYGEDGHMIKKQMRRNGSIVIPGSSLKGAVRSVAEAVSYSCAVKPPFHKLARALPPGNRVSCNAIDKKGLCITCSMFGMCNGTAAYRGKIHFGEFVLQSGGTVDKKIPVLESPFKDYPVDHDVFGESEKGESTYGNERLYYCRACDTGNCKDCTKEDYYTNVGLAGTGREMKFRGRKFYNPDKEKLIQSGKESWHEFIEPQSVLEGEVTFQNLRETEGKLLAYALDIGHHFIMKLGYGKPLGYGRAVIDLTGAGGIDSRYPGERPVSAELVRQWAEDYKSESPEEIRSVIHEFERIMQ